MDDEELNKLFSQDEEGKEDVVNDSVSEKTTEVNLSDSKNDESSDKVTDKATDKVADKESVKETPEEKKKRKDKARQEKIKEIEAFEAKLEKKRAADKKKRREKKEYDKLHYVPLKDRQYLEDFPLTFPALMTLLVAILILTISLSFALNPVFRLKNIVIEGNYALSDEEIIDSIGMTYGDHLLRSYYGIENRLKETKPYIESIDISFSMPSTLHVQIVERTKICYIRTPDGYAAIDEHGTVLEFSSSMDENIHPLLCGLDIDNVVLGQQLDLEDNLSYQKMIIILGAVLSAEQNSIYDSDYSFFENLREVRILPSGTIFLVVNLPTDSDLTVKLNDITTINDKMHWLMYAIEEGAMDNLPAGSLDMTEESPIYHEYESYNS